MPRYKYANAAECAGFLACEIVDSVEAVFICQLCGSHRDNHPGFPEEDPVVMSRENAGWRAYEKRMQERQMAAASEPVRDNLLEELKAKRVALIERLLELNTVISALETKEVMIQSLERQLEAVAVGEAPSHLRPHGCVPGHDHVFRDGFATCGRCGASKAMVLP